MSAQPPSALLDVAAKVNERLDQFLEQQSTEWSGVDPRLAEAIEQLRSIVARGGKRIRAAFCYWAWQGSTGSDSADTSVVIDVGAALELLQAFALIHDDIMDDSVTRRGQPTIHVTQAQRLTSEGWRGEPRRFGEGVAILIGDLSHAFADKLMADSGPAARLIWDDLRIELNLGQYLDLRSAASGQLDLETARQVSTFKSALYTIVRPLQLGSSLGRAADPELLAVLDGYGRPLGQAFQLRDDLLGIVGDEILLGKPVGDDLREGKPTELLSLAVERATPEEARVLDQVGQRDLSTAEIKAIVEVFVATDAISDIEARIDRLVVEAVSIIPRLPFTDMAKEALGDLADYVAARNS
ncbi:MAG: polyprenyl synthetase family protein [Actinomycetia bacterium]|nr:polyprenyl synthetase family protein [Actinomycetes bacterium]